jgi:hypothetical protein
LPLINKLVLAPLGMAIEMPTVGSGAGFQFITPLRIAVEPNARRDALVGTLLHGLQPVRQQVFDALIKASCQLGNVVTIYDIATGSLSGAGSFAIELGGVQTSSGDASEFAGDLGFPSTVSSGGGLLGPLTGAGSTGVLTPGDPRYAGGTGACLGGRCPDGVGGG